MTLVVEVSVQLLNAQDFAHFGISLTDPPIKRLLIINNLQNILLIKIPIVLKPGCKCNVLLFLYCG